LDDQTVVCHVAKELAIASNFQLVQREDDLAALTREHRPLIRNRSKGELLDLEVELLGHAYTKPRRRDVRNRSGQLVARVKVHLDLQLMGVKGEAVQVECFGEGAANTAVVDDIGFLVRVAVPGLVAPIDDVGFLSDCRSGASPNTRRHH
jgi:hypothetical protein